jgi:hypothetical protein
LTTRRFVSRAPAGLRMPVNDRKTAVVVKLLAMDRLLAFAH